MKQKPIKFPTSVGGPFVALRTLYSNQYTEI